MPLTTLTLALVISLQVSPEPTPEPQVDEAQPEATPAAVEAEDQPKAVPEPAASGEAADPAADDRAGKAVAEVSREDPKATHAKIKPPAEAKVVAGDEVTWGFAGIPAVAFSSDAGFGFGAIASLFAFTPGYEKPYRARLTAQIFMTTRLIQDHNLQLDFLDIFGLPLRLEARGGYFQTITANYCGFGNLVTCDPKEAIQAANAAGLSNGEEREQFLRRYYTMRMIRLRGIARLRYLLKGGDHRIEAFGALRETGYIHGDFVDEDGDGQSDFFPFPGSRYAQDFPEGENGLASVVTAGLIFDSRDNEPSPTSGYWIEAHLRAAPPLLSTWTFAGANLTLRGYIPLTKSRNVVLTSKLTLDAAIGDMPKQEILRVNDARDMIAFGGIFFGRGIREQRYVGKLKVIDQTELRWTFAEADWLGQNFRFTTVGFTDAGWIGQEVYDFGGDPARLIVTWGGALRIAWNENFVVYADVAVSPDEGYAPQVYINVNQLW